MDIEPLVSVVLAVYNGDRHLSESIQSVLAQTYTNFEFIIIDDASNDNTPAIIRHYSSDSRIKSLRNETNLGLAKSLNIGLNIANGKYIARLDADDIAESTRLKQQVVFLQSNSPTVLVGSWARHINDEGIELSVSQLPSGDKQLQWLMLFTCPFYHSAVMFHRSLVLSCVGLYNEELDYSMDYEYWFRISSRFPVANLETVLINYRETNNSMTGKLKTPYTEGYRIRFGIISDLLDWRNHRRTKNKTLYDIMCKLIVNPNNLKNVRITDYIFAIKNIMQLRKACNRYYKVSRIFDNKNIDINTNADINALFSDGSYSNELKNNIQVLVFYMRIYVRMRLRKTM